MFKRSVASFLVILTAWSASPATALATQQPGATRIAKTDLSVSDSVNKGQRARVILRYKDGAATRLKNRLAARGLRLKRELTRTGAFAVEMSAAQIKAFALDADVVSISA